MTNHDSGVEATTTTASVVPDNNNNNNHKTIVELATTNPDIIVTGDHTTTTTTTSTTNHSNNMSNHHNNSSNTTSSVDNTTKTDAKPSTTATTAKKRKRTHYSNELDDIRVPEKIETKKRKLLGAMTAATTTIPIAALGAAEQIVQSPASSCSLLIDPFDFDHHSQQQQQQPTMIDASGSQHRRSYCTDVSLLPPSAIIAVTPPLSTTISTTTTPPSTTTTTAATSTTTPPTPITAPAYHYKSKNVDTTHVIVRSNKALNSQQQQQQASDSSQPHQSTNESSQQQQQSQQQQKLGGSNYTANSGNSSSSSSSSSSSGFDKKTSSIVDEHMEHTDALLEDDDDEDENGDDHLWYSGAMNPHISIEDTAAAAATGTDGHSTLVHSQSSDALDATGGPSANTSGKSNVNNMGSGRFINPMELIPPSPNVGKVGIQLVKQINTQYVFEKYKDANIRNPIMSPGSIELHWDRRPERVLVMKQIHTDRTDKQFERVVDYLVNEKKVSVYVEPVVYEKLKWPCLQTFPDYLNSVQGRNLSNGGATQQQNGPSSASSSASTTTGAGESSSNDTNNPSSAALTHQQPGYRNLHKLIDLIICLGGDGTILHTASMFPSAVPPILGFNMGSLGFLTAFNVKRYKEYITHVFNGSVYLSTRMRLTCKIRRKDGTIENHRYQVLNEIVVDRGPSPYLCNLDCYCNNVHITTVQADGLILATPTGSTAYSMSAGGSIVHPNVNCLLLTPICPHSLSFRPIILPDSTILTIKVPQDSRATAWISFDGKSRQELQRGDAIIVTTSIWPVPLICKTEETSEWFMNLTNIFNWNQRERQKSFTSSQDEDESSGSEAE